MANVTTDAPEPDDFAKRMSAAIEKAAAAEADVAALSSETALVATNLQGEAVREQFKAKQSEIAKAQKAVQEAAEEMRKLMEQKRFQMQGILAPLEAQAARLREGVWSIGLYLGVGEEVVPLRGGSVAAEGTPLVIRQQVLAMDEETLIAAEDGGLRISDIDQFDEWITGNPAHLQQVLPDQRGVVAIIPRRADRQSLRRSDAERETWMLMRNGERLFRLKALDFNAGVRLIPREDEFTGYFEAYAMVDGVRVKTRLQPGTRQWEEAESAADAQSRHYMRVALILQGIIERTNVFEGFPEGVSALDQSSYDSGQIVLLADDEKALGTGRKPFYEWLREKNGQLRPGMRIIGAFGGTAFREANSYESRSAWGKHSRLTPVGAELPPYNTILVVEAGGDGLVARYDRTRQEYLPSARYIGGEYRVPKTRASVRIYQTDRFIIPIDLVTIPEMEYYLRSRSERHSYLDMVPLLQEAIDVLRDEAKAEAPFRAIIAAAIAESEGVDVAEIEDASNALVDWWKVAYKFHRALVTGDADLERKATRQILAERKARRVAESLPTDAIEKARAAAPGAMAVFRRPNGSLVALVPEKSQYGKLNTGLYFAQHERGTVKRWVLSQPHILAKMTLVWNDARWDAWDKVPGVIQPSDETISSIIDELRSITPAPDSHLEDTTGAQLIAVTMSHNDYTTSRTVTSARGRYVLPDGRSEVDGSFYVLDVYLTWKQTKAAITFERFTSSTDAWNLYSNFGDDKRTGAPWEGHGRLVYLDESLMASTLAVVERLKNAARQDRQLSERRHALTRAVEMAVDRRNRERERATYIEAYGDAQHFDSWLRKQANREFASAGPELTAAIERAIPTFDSPIVENFIPAREVPEGAERELLAGFTVAEADPENKRYQAVVTDIQFPIRPDEKQP